VWFAVAMAAHAHAPMHAAEVARYSENSRVGKPARVDLGSARGLGFSRSVSTKRGGGEGVSNSNQKIQWHRGEIRRTVETLSKRVKHDVKESGIKTCVVALEVAAKRERRTGKQDDCMSYNCTFACGAGKQYTPVVHVVEGIGLPMVLPARVAGSRCK
jgi:hypothetical protein